MPPHIHGVLTMIPRPLALITLCLCLVSTVVHGQTIGLDPAFGHGGLVVSQFGPGADAAQDFAIAPDGTLVAVGSRRSPDTMIS